MDEESFFHGRHGRLEEAQLSDGFKLEKNWSAQNGQEGRCGYFNCPAIIAENRVAYSPPFKRPFPMEPPNPSNAKIGVAATFEFLWLGSQLVNGGPRPASHP